MTKPIILKAEDHEDMKKIAKSFLENGYKIISEDDIHIAARKRNFGSYYVHLFFLLLILFVINANSWLIYLTCILYMIYFTYFLFKKSKILLITTETLDKDGNPAEFDNLEEINLN